MQHEAKQTPHPKGSKPGEYNAWDFILWIFGGWIWAGFRWYGRHHDWTRTKQNVCGIGTGLGLWLVIIIASASGGSSGLVNDPNTASTTTQATTPVATVDEGSTDEDPGYTEEEWAAKKKADRAKRKAEATPTPKPKPTPKPVTSGQENALESAENYIDVLGFSKRGLHEQLTSTEHYSEADATYAVNHVHANWNHEAAETAQNYLDALSFSKTGLYEQLTSTDHYTASQARYAVEKVY